MLRRFALSLVIAVLATGGGLWAQNSISEVFDTAQHDLQDAGRRQQVVAQIQTLMETRHLAAKAKARQLGLPERTVHLNGRIVEIADFDGNEPVYLTTHNVNAAISTGANLLRLAPYSVTGSGLTVGIWDGGGVRTTHQEFTGRVTIKDGAALIDHSTHVGGTIGALGVDAAAKGMAPAVLIDSYEWNNDKNEQTARGASYPGEAGKIYLSNHSYGVVSGWSYTGLSSPVWSWYGSGTTSTSFEPDFGRYDTTSRDSDSMAYSLPYYLVVRSAGNDRLDNPAAGTPVSLSTSTTSAVAYDPASHPAGDGVYRGSGYDTIGYDAVAKNVLTVGSAGDAVSGGTRSLAGAYMSSYSSWGPTDDGRIKPDVVANGEDVYSSFSGTDASYGRMSGTSMATPNTTGSAALLLNWWGSLFPGHAPRSSTLKGLLIHTADDLGTPGPDYQFGWGMLNVKAAADLLQEYKNSPGTRRVVEDRLTTTTTSRGYVIMWDGVSPIRATLCWVDPAGTSTTSADSRTARLVNNLNLTVTGPTGTVYQPWVMPFVGNWTNATLSSAATTGVNNTDNVEQVFIPSPGAAGLYTVTVNSSGTLTNSLQNFSLLLSGGVSTASLAAPSASAVSPNSASSGAQTLTITGNGFLHGANVKLTKTGQTDVPCTGQEIVSDSAKVRLTTTGMATGQWNVVITNPDGQSTTLANAFTIVGGLFSENFESGAVGWTHSAATPTYTIDTWNVSSTSKSYSATHSAFASGPTSKNIMDLYSPLINIPAGASVLQFSFWHNYNFQSRRDGGVLEFSTDGGTTWFDVSSSGSGAAFVTGTYPNTISSSSSPINGRSAWTGNASAAWSQVVLNLTDTAKYAGKAFRARWRLTTNTGTASTGWYIDDVLLTGAVAAVNAAPSIATAAEAAPSPAAGMSTQLSVLGSDDAGEAALTYTWSALGGSFERPVSFTENGTNAAKNTTANVLVAGDYTFDVTVRDEQGLTATSSVDVTVTQTATSLVVMPSTASISYGTNQNFTASVLDQFGDALSVQPSVTWSTSGGGTIGVTGIFTPTSTGGPFTITANSGTLSGTAAVTITPASASVLLSNLQQIYDGQAKPVTVTTSPAGLPIAITYNGSSIVPVDFGSYTVTASITDPHYTGSATGTLVISGEPITTWQDESFSPAQITAGAAADDADPDGDGLANLAEYALGANPNASTPAFTPQQDANGLSVVFTRPKGLPNVTYSAESSADMVNWSPVALIVVEDGPEQTVRATDPLNTGTTQRRFIRLRFTRVP